MSEPIDGLDAIGPFIDQGIVSEVLFQVKSGKEAVVYCCRGGTASKRELLAAKVYRSLQWRSFRNDQDYFEGRVILGGRNRRAFARGTDWGRDVQFGYWRAGEWEALRDLHAAGADVPEPIARSGGAVLLEYLGNDEGPALQLVRTTLTREEAEAAYERLLWNVELFLSRDRVHADLSAHNVMWWEGRVRVIDFPQSVDARTNPRAREFLLRDLENLDTWFARCGVAVRGREFGADLWERFALGEIG